MMDRTTSYLVDPCIMPFCKGCGHSHVVRQLNEALRKLQLPPKDICLVSDIGCIGLVDSLFLSPHTVHTTHGRSTAFAAGIELADSVLDASRLKTIVLIGDGGAMIGLLHLVHAALLNVDVTVLLCNNFLFGMTGGQNSALSPLDFITPTTPTGNFVPPIDMCKVMIDAHAQYAARKLATDKDLSDTIAAAIAHPGFAIVEIVELCTEYGLKYNKLSGTVLRQIIETNGQQLGILKQSLQRTEFGSTYTKKFPKNDSPEHHQRESWITQLYQHRLDKEIGIFVAGSAGEHVQSAAAMLCESAVMSHLTCTLKTDNPVTQGTGFSIAEIKLSSSEIFYTGIDTPDVVIAVSEDGMKELVERDVMKRLSSSATVLLDASINVHEIHADVIRFPFRSICKPEKAAAAALAFFLSRSNIFPFEAYIDLLTKKRTRETNVFPDEFLYVLTKHSHI